jgi:hypothetical protein
VAISSLASRRLFLAWKLPDHRGGSGQWIGPACWSWRLTSQKQRPLIGENASA